MYNFIKLFKKNFKFKENCKIFVKKEQNDKVIKQNKQKEIVFERKLISIIRNTKKLMKKLFKVHYKWIISRNDVINSKTTKIVIIINITKVK